MVRVTTPLQAIPQLICLTQNSPDSWTVSDNRCPSKTNCGIVVFCDLAAPKLMSKPVLRRSCGTSRTIRLDAQNLENSDWPPVSAGWRRRLRKSVSSSPEVDKGSIDWPGQCSDLVQVNLKREGFAAAPAASVEWDKPANVRVSPDESVIVVDDVPLVECMSSAARSADWLIPAFR